MVSLEDNPTLKILVASPAEPPLGIKYTSAVHAVPDVDPVCRRIDFTYTFLFEDTVIISVVFPAATAITLVSFLFLMPWFSLDV